MTSERPSPQRRRRDHPPMAKAIRGNGRPHSRLAVLGLLCVALAIGFWRHYALHAQVMSAAEQRRDFVPSVRTAPVRASGSTMSVSWPGTTEAFEQANIYARASGYISKREVDIGSHVKAGQLLVEITAPELEHQIAQAEGTLAQLKAALLQAKANRDLAQVTWDRDSTLVQQGWVTKQQGDTDRLSLEARDAAVAVAAANITAQEAQLRVLNQQKLYQSVIAPFDGVITQRNIDIGSLVQADATSGTFLFTLMHSDVIRIQLYVPQDEAFGLAPGVEAVVRVPEMPGRDFPGTVTRLADALQPGTRTLLTEIDVPNPDHALTPGVLLQRRTENPAQNAFACGPVRGDHLQPGWSQCCRCRGRSRAHSPGKGGARLRHDRRGERRSQRRRPGDPQSAGRSDRWPQGEVRPARRRSCREVSRGSIQLGNANLQALASVGSAACSPLTVARVVKTSNASLRGGCTSPTRTGLMS